MSNLTNLLALHPLAALGVGPAGYVGLVWAPALAAIAATVAVLALRHRRALAGRYEAGPAPAAPDRVLLVVASTCCVLLGPAFVTGVPPAIPSVAAAVVLLVAVAVRDRSLLRRISLPWGTVAGVSALFVVVDVALAAGLRDLLVAVTLPGTSPVALFVLGGAGALAANAVNNLPAYLALESVAADAPERLVALLVGVNAGPLVTVWGSVATLLWQQRCRSQGLTVPAGYVAREGLLCAAAAVTAALVALHLVR